MGLTPALWLAERRVTPAPSGYRCQNLTGPLWAEMVTTTGKKMLTFLIWIPLINYIKIAMPSPWRLRYINKTHINIFIVLSKCSTSNKNNGHASHPFRNLSAIGQSHWQASAVFHQICHNLALVSHKCQIQTSIKLYQELQTLWIGHIYNASGYWLINTVIMISQQGWGPPTWLCGVYRSRYLVHDCGNSSPVLCHQLNLV